MKGILNEGSNRRCRVMFIKWRKKKYRRSTIQDIFPKILAHNAVQNLVCHQPAGLVFTIIFFFFFIRPFYCLFITSGAFGSFANICVYNSQRSIVLYSHREYPAEGVRARALNICLFFFFCADRGCKVCVYKQAGVFCAYNPWILYDSSHS